MASYMKKTSAARGQTIRVDHGRDDSSMKSDGVKQSKFGGSTTNLAHSISGASAKSDSNEGTKNKFN